MLRAVFVVVVIVTALSIAGLVAAALPLTLCASGSFISAVVDGHWISLHALVGSFHFSLRLFSHRALRFLLRSLLASSLSFLLSVRRDGSAVRSERWLVQTAGLAGTTCDERRLTAT